jgi:two-component system, OmpR family, alkaline phosphatase synthesis response regulator PhoP
MDGPLVLLADDEAHITCVVAERLRTAGFNVTTARDGEEALEMALRLRPALLITDLQMPRMSGLELARRLAATPIGANTPVLMLTARGYVLGEADLATTNIRAVIGKPFSAREVVRRASELIGRRAALAPPRPEAA